MEQKENIELRSEKARMFIGQVPPSLVRFGTVLVTIILLIIAIAFYKTPYPISIEANGEVLAPNTIQVFVPYRFLYIFKEPRTAFVIFEGYNDVSCQYKITDFNPTIIHHNDNNYFKATGTEITNVQKKDFHVQRHMKVYAKIIVSDKTLWQQIFK